MTKPKALVLTGHGINCDYEAEFAFTYAGAEARRVHVNDIIDGHYRLEDYQILVFPGGFSYGDDIAAGRVLANKCRTTLGEPLQKFVDSDKLIIGICNGFQVMMQLGLFGKRLGERVGTLSFNDSGRFEDRWVHLKAAGEKCVFTRDIDQVYYPVAHGEGKFYTDAETMNTLFENGQVVFQYATSDGNLAQQQFPLNPNGAVGDIAGICDTTGRIFGLMPHPERFLRFTNHPHWTRIKDRLQRLGQPIPEEGQGLKIFRNAVEYFV